jgi:hypothetical protein
MHADCLTASFCEAPSAVLVTAKALSLPQCQTIEASKRSTTLKKDCRFDPIEAQAAAPNEFDD